MIDMKALAQLLRELEEQLSVCMRCGMCQVVCPLFSETCRESDVARGKLALLDGLIREMFKNPQGVSDRLSRCLLCGSCAANCPSGVKVLDIFLKARAILGAAMGMNPAKRLLFRGMLARPDLFDRIVEWGARLQGFFIKPVDELLGTSCTRFASPLFDRHFNSLSENPFHKRTGRLNTHAGSSGLKVGFFIGCVIDKVFPRVGEAVLGSLLHHGVGVFIPDNLGCCGIPALASGDAQTFAKLVRHNLDKLAEEPIDYLVTACATCTSVIQKIWPAMTENLLTGERERVMELSRKTLDISQFLVEKIGAGGERQLREEGRGVISYHDPCHLKKSLGVAAQPRSLIQANERYELQEMNEADWCCGCGGSFNLRHHDLSESIGKRKRDNIVKSGCSVVATGCPACMLQISDMLSKAGCRIEVKHAIEIYAESLGA
jgi:glycolate oxidase iron-sulfur subunit